MSIRSEIDKENEKLNKRLVGASPGAEMLIALRAIYERLGDIETIIAESGEVG